MDYFVSENHNNSGAIAAHNISGHGLSVCETKQNWHLWFEFSCTVIALCWGVWCSRGEETRCAILRVDGWWVLESVCTIHFCAWLPFTGKTKCSRCAITLVFDRCMTKTYPPCQWKFICVIDCLFVSLCDGLHLYNGLAFKLVAYQKIYIFSCFL